MLAAAAFAMGGVMLAGITGEARAELGNYDQYGYQAPGKYTKSKAAQGGSFFGSGKSGKSKASGQDDEEDSKPAKGPAELSGGPRPSIAPMAPPKVSFPNGYGAGTIIIDTNGRKLYYVLSSSQAYRYPISVGREGFTWTGTQKISREVDWPDWRPPAEMLERKPNLPELMTGGIRNPLGVKALYLGNTLYRIHGTNDAKSIGYAASSGCFRMLNGHVVHLASIAGVGTTVHVLNKLPSHLAKAN
jgi:lipoprotein-anchoring transpeptidase ErfK/SrfK